MLFRSRARRIVDRGADHCGNRNGLAGAGCEVPAGECCRDCREEQDQDDPGCLAAPAWRRVACLGFAVATCPFQFAPAAIVARKKLRERRTVAAVVG